MEAQPLLRLEELALTYASATEQTFSGLSLCIEARQAIVLRGPSGVGKSTLLRCMAGLEARASGSIHFAGRPVLAKGVPAFRNQAVYVAQSPPRMPMSVEESMRAAFAFRHQEEAYDAEQVKTLCAGLALSEKLLSRPLAELSGGEAQRFGVLRALLLKPRLLLLDEPASSLDAESREAMAKVLGAWFQESERSIVICSHEPSWCLDLITHTWTLGPGGSLEIGGKSP